MWQEDALELLILDRFSIISFSVAFEKHFTAPMNYLFACTLAIDTTRSDLHICCSWLLRVCDPQRGLEGHQRILPP